MQSEPHPFTHDVVLIGGGHTHALVLRKWGMSPLAGARLTLINPGPTAPYSGMLPGFVAGHYDRAALDIDLVRLARFAGARLILGAAAHLDPGARTVHVPNRPPVAYDLCSIDIGITSNMTELAGFAHYAVPAKPLGRFADAWQAFVARGGAAHVVVIGAGVAGAELAMAMAHRLGVRGDITLIDRGQALGALGVRARARIAAHLSELGVKLIETSEITRVAADHVALSDGREIRADFVTGAAGARPHGWLENSGLALEQGFVRVDARLQTSDADVFAVGDCAHLAHDPRPKAGVYAVRQAPVLYDNLRARLRGGKTRDYKAQRDYLKLISLGQQSAIGERFGLTFSGPWVWRWKDRIDQSFMQRFRELPDMPVHQLPFERTQTLAETIGPKPMCGGCGAKIGRAGLRASLGDAAETMFDDAAILNTGDARQVMTTDHLRAVTPDAVMMTRIAVQHALGDIWAMGARAQAATVSLILPRQSDALAARQLTEITETARAELDKAGARLVGGHTTFGDELTIGFTLTGLCDDVPITLGGARAGDILILTKPLGSGVMMAAEMQKAARGDWVAAALSEMVRPQQEAARILAAAHAMTDVTGFGLIGHLANICEASHVGARLDPDAVPLMDGALELAESGMRSTLYRANRAIAPNLPDVPRIDLLFDPQTAGGLLAALAPDRAEACLADLLRAGYPAAVIGQLTSGDPTVSLVSGSNR